MCSEYRVLVYDAVLLRKPGKKGTHEIALHKHSARVQANLVLPEHSWQK